MRQNPWAGLASYQDPASGSTLLFCGRDNESYDLAALVDDNIFCTLYGKSGTGKTSLLNAGMFPRLRDMGYLPLSIRLGMEALGSTFQQCIAARLGKAATLQTADTVPLPADDQDEQWLWAWFARTRFVDSEGKVRFPVLVFDQFEEVFRSRRTEAETLLRQVHFMMDPSHSLGDDYDYNFRFLASIREDDLYLLEDSLDRHFMGDMKQCRYRLNALTDEGARDVILKPGEGLFAAGEQDAIVDTIIGIARSADGSINTNILSLVCSRIYDHYQRSGDSHISLDLVKRFVSSNPFEQFYNEVTESLGEKEKQFIEDRLVDAAGRRGSVSEPDFEKNVPNGAHLLEGTGRILQRVASGTEGRSYRIELIHDSFCAPLADQKLKRAARRRRRITFAAIAMALVVVAIAAYIVIVSILNARLIRGAFNQQERFYARQASQLLDEGDTYTALLLLNELLDPTGQFKDIPLQPEAEIQIRRALEMIDTSAWQVVNVIRRAGNFNDVQVTEDGKYVLASMRGLKKIFVYNLLSGEELQPFSIDQGDGDPSMWYNMFEFKLDHSGKYVAVLDRKTLSLYDFKTRDRIYDTIVDDSSYFDYPQFSRNDDTFYISKYSHADHMNHPTSGTYSLKIGSRNWNFIIPNYALCQLSNNSMVLRGCSDLIYRHNDFPEAVRLSSATKNIAKGVSIPKDFAFSRIMPTDEDEIYIYDDRGADIVRVSLKDNRIDGVWKIPFSKTVSHVDILHNHVALIHDKNMLSFFDLDSSKIISFYENRFKGNLVRDAFCANKDQNIVIPYQDKIVVLQKSGKYVRNTLDINKRKFDYSYQYFHLLHNDSIKVMSWGPDYKGTFEVYDNLTNRCLFYDSTDNYMFSKVDVHERYVAVCVRSDSKVSERVFDLQKMSWVKSFDNNYYGFMFSPDGEWMYAWHNPNIVKIKVGTWQEFVVIPDLRSEMIVTAILNDGKDLLCYRWDANLYVYDAETGVLKHTINDINAWGFEGIPDGSAFISSSWDGWLYMFDAKTYNVVNRCIAESAIENSTFSPDGKYFVTPMDGGFKLWDTKTLSVLQVIEDKRIPETSSLMHFSKDGKYLIFYSDLMTENGPLGLVWYPLLTREQLKERVRQLALRKLTDEEKTILRK